MTGEDDISFENGLSLITIDVLNQDKQCIRIICAQRGKPILLKARVQASIDTHATVGELIVMQERYKYWKPARLYVG